MTKPCKQLLQTHLPKSPDMDSLSSESLRHSTSHETNVAVSQGIGNDSEKNQCSFRRQKVKVFFFLVVNSCDWFISSYDLIGAIVRSF